MREPVLRRAGSFKNQKMKLIKFDNVTAAGIRSGKATIIFNSKGQICLNKHAISALNLTPGMKVSICQDEENPYDWYLVMNDENGFTLRQSSSGQMIFNNSYLCKMMLDFTQENYSTLTATISTEPVVIQNEDSSQSTLYWMNIQHAKGKKPQDKSEEE